MYTDLENEGLNFNFAFFERLPLYYMVIRNRMNFRNALLCSVYYLFVYFDLVKYCLRNYNSCPEELWYGICWVYHTFWNFLALVSSCRHVIPPRYDWRFGIPILGSCRRLSKLRDTPKKITGGIPLRLRRNDFLCVTR